MTGRKTVAPIRSKSSPIEHFWLCERCATTMTLELTAAGEVRLVPLCAGPCPVEPAPPADFFQRRSASA